MFIYQNEKFKKKKKKKKKNFMLFIYGKTYVVQHPCNLVYFVLLR